jgi:hypothetical protein
VWYRVRGADDLGRALAEVRRTAGLTQAQAVQNSSAPATVRHRPGVTYAGRQTTRTVVTPVAWFEKYDRTPFSVPLS